jgi:hypothetical protein
MVLVAFLLALPVLTPDVKGAGDGYLLKRSPEETCHACHKTDKNAPNDPNSIKTHNSAITGSTKWPSGWGVAGGEYGEFICTTCHTPHGTTNIYLIRQTIDTPDGSNWATSGSPSVTVDFRKKSTSDSPNPGVADGVMGSGAAGTTNVCMVCHSLTSHFRWNGSGSDQLHGDVGGEAGNDCTVCHSHKNGFAHGLGGTGCWQCHGHDAGYVFTYDGTEYTSQGRGTFQSHSTHTENDSDDLKGPNVNCDTCHDTSDFPYFKSGVDTNGDGKYDLSETDVCKPCHSPGGDYDGVNDPVIGAKANWRSGVYVSTNDSTLQTGKEKWCAGCHDDGNPGNGGGSTIGGAAAPNVIGDEQGAYTYGTGWGFYKTGHGLPNSSTYPASGGVSPGAGRNCDACHNLSTQHIFGGPPSRAYNDGDSSSTVPSVYRIGYRLKQVPMGLGTGTSTQEPMLVPWPVNTANSANNYRLCLTCHDSGPFTDSGNMNTNFVTAGINRHQFHLVQNTLQFPADWNGSNTSMINCIVCHNVHGSTRLAMVRDGKLTGREPGLEIWYKNDALTANIGTTNPPTPADVTLAASDGTAWMPKSATNLCVSCHNEASLMLYGKDRTPFQDVEQAPMLVWTGETGYLSDGANPDSAPSGSTFTFRVKYKDTNNDAPSYINLLIDTNDDGTVDATYAMTGTDSGDVNYTNGKIYSKTIILTDAGSSVIRYKFEASDGTLTATGSPSNWSTVSLVGQLNHPPELAWVTWGATCGYRGVTPAAAVSGTAFEFRVTYTDADNNPPSSIQVWVDSNDDGIYEPGEKYTMDPAAGGDGVYTNGETYTKTLTLSYAGDGMLNYRFVASDGTDAATGDPVNTQLVTVIDSGLSLKTVCGSGCDYTTIQAAVDAVDGAHAVLVKEGTYNQSPYLYIWGGADSNTTIASECGPDKTTIHGDGTSYAVYFLSSSGSVVDGFTITNGTSGVGINGGNDTIANCKIHGNSVRGIYTSNSSSVLHLNSSEIYSHTHTKNDSGTAAAGSDASNIVDDSKSWTANEWTGYNVVMTGGTAANIGQVRSISSNTADTLTVSTAFPAAVQTGDTYSIYITADYGGGIYLNQGNGHTITDSVIRNNSATVGGGGIYINGGGMTLTNTTIKDNTAASYGAGVDINGGNTDYSGCTLTGNVSSGVGGAVYLSNASSSASFLNSIIAGNQASQGGAAYTNGGPVTVNLSTVADNHATSGNGGAFCTATTSTISATNSILWNNLASGTGHNAYFNGGSMTISDSIVSSGNDGIYTNVPYFAGTFSTLTFNGYLSDNDPMFVDAAAGNYHIQGISDAVDNANATGAPSDDIDGDSRPQGVGYDIGADEYLTPAGLPVLSWTGEPGYESDGADPDEVDAGSNVTFRVDYTAGHAPVIIQVWVDKDGNGAYSEDEKFDLTADGTHYSRTLSLNAVPSGEVQYRFYATDGSDEATGAPVAGGSVTVLPQVPAAPTIGTPQALSATSIRWNFTDNATNEEGFKVLDTSDTVKVVSAVPNLTYLDEGGLSPNTQYTRHVVAYNVTGDSVASAPASKYTLSSAPNVTADKTASAWYNTADVIFTNAAGFGSGGVQYYRYVWDQNPGHTFNDTETQWTGGTLTVTATADGSWYLHVKAYNAEDIANGTQDYGPYYYESVPPTATDLSPANGATNVDLSSPLTLTLADDDSGVNWSTFQITLSGNKGYSKTYSSGSAQVTKTGTPASYSVTITPDEDFGSDETITVTVNVEDEAGNALALPTWSFTTRHVDFIDVACGQSIQTAINSAADGNIVRVASNCTYHENINFNGKLITVKSVSGAASTTIDGASTSTNLPVVTFSNNETSSAVLKGFTIDNQAPANSLTRGISITNGATPTIKNCVIEGNALSTGNNGAGIYINGGSASISGTTVGGAAANTCQSGCGLYATALSAALSISNSTVSNNSATVSGGGIYLSSTGQTTTISNTTVSNNSVSQYGGGIYVDNSPLVIENSNIDNNKCTQPLDGGGIYLQGASTTLTITGTTSISNDSARTGGGIYMTGIGAVSITGAAIDANTAISGSSSGGGGIYMTGMTHDISMTDTSISNNTSTARGAGINLTTTAAITFSLTDCNVDNNTVTNTASYNGGGLYISSASITATITGGSISGNTAGNGGGIVLAGGLDTTISGTVIAGNTAATGTGGGITISGNSATSDYSTLNISKSYIRGNRATTYGGGFNNGGWADTTMTNCMVTGNLNEGNIYCDGGGIYNSGTLSVLNSTVVGNYTTRYGGGLFGGGTVGNSIIWGNSSGGSLSYYNIYGSPSVSYSDIGPSQITYEGSNGNINLPPQFADLQQASSGNPTTAGNFHIQGSSPCVDSGNNADAPAGADIDGDTRIINGIVDMGADETLGPNATTIGEATVSVAGDTSINVSMSYYDDANGSNTYTVDYKLSSDSTWTNWVTGAVHATNPYTTTITGLAVGATYDVRMTYNDADGVNGTNPQTVTNVTLNHDSSTVGTATATADSDTSITVNMPYTGDNDGNNTYTVDYKLSSDSSWTNWKTDDTHVASPYTTTITGLTTGETYDVRMTYNDADGVNGTNPQTVTSILVGHIVSGTVYADDGVTPVADGTTVRLIVNGSSAGTATTSGGAYSIVAAGLTAGDAIIVYIDGTATQGTTVTVAGSTNLLSGVNIYGGRLTTRNDNGGSLTNALMATALGGYSDTDILYSVDGSNNLNSTATELYVPAGYSYAPGAAVTAVGMDIKGTLSAAANDINVSGNWDATGGVFTSTGTVTFDATGGTKTIMPGGTDANHDFQNIVFNDGGGTATFQLGGDLAVNGNLTVTDGIFDTTVSNYAVTVAGNLSDTANSRFTANASTITVGGDVSLNANNDATESTDFNSASLVLNGAASQITYSGLSTPWNNGFNNLTAGQGGVINTINSSLSILNDLTIGTGGLTGAVTLYMRGNADVLFFDSASTLSLTNLTLLANSVNLPTLTSGYNTNIVLGGVGPQTVTQTGAVTLSAGKAMKINGDGDGTRQNTLNTNGFALTVGGDLIIGAGSDTGAKGLTANASTITVGGNFTINSGTNTFNAGTSTVTLNGTGQHVNGSATFYNLTKSVTSADTLTFEAGQTTTIASGGTVTLNGAISHLLTLTSSTDSSAWNFVVNSGAIKAIGYVRVFWSDASGSDSSQIPISPTNSVNGGNNTDWFAVVPAGPVYICNPDCTNYPTIQLGINAANTGETVMVKDGTYHENIDFSGKAITVQSLNGAATTTIDGVSTSTNAPVVTFSTGITSSAVLDGFTIDNQATASTNSLTRGIYIVNGASPTIQNCIVEGNVLDSGGTYGAGIYINGGSATIIGTIVGTSAKPNTAAGGGSGIYATALAAPLSISGSDISYNSTTGLGAGIYLNSAGQTTTISNTTISYNSSGSSGAGIYSNSPLSISGGSIAHNWTTGNGSNGGGIFLTSSGNTTISNGAVISSNTAKGTGGGIYCAGPTLTINDCSIESNIAQSTEAGGIYISSAMNLNRTVIRGNRTYQYGGGISVHGGTTTLTNCMITGNSADGTTYSRGGGIYDNGGTILIYDSTLAGNYARSTSTSGDGFYAAGTDDVVQNSIVWGNTGGTTAQITGSPSVTYSDIGQAGYAGSNGNINSDPQFIDYKYADSGGPTTDGDFHIQSGSPCKDAIAPADYSGPSDDIDGDSRPQNTNYDMGADEYVP